MAEELLKAGPQREDDGEELSPSRWGEGGDVMQALWKFPILLVFIGLVSAPSGWADGDSMGGLPALAERVEAVEEAVAEIQPLAGYEIVRVFERCEGIVPPFGCGLDAICPDGKVVVGGGGSCAIPGGEAFFPIAMNSSEPGVLGDRWEVGCSNHDTVPRDIAIRAQAICVDEPAEP